MLSIGVSTNIRHTGLNVFNILITQHNFYVILSLVPFPSNELMILIEKMCSKELLKNIVNKEYNVSQLLLITWKTGKEVSYYPKGKILKMINIHILAML